MGPIKTFTAQLATKEKWEEKEFKLKKSELRKQYEVVRAHKQPKLIKYLNSNNLLSLLKSKSKSFVQNSS